ncbi:Calycin-like protein [Hyaloscypha finlandica]|nr:Calycin-like protein [Hyaloscypha finlandica]
MPVPTHGLTEAKVLPQFDKDIRDLHLIYDYDAHDSNGKPEKWRYEMWFFSEKRIVYKIHGGPMAGRINYQTASYQCIRPGELWQCNWLEETGTICSLVYDIPNKKISTLLAFSQGHWQRPQEAHGDKRNPADFERWRGLASIGKQTDRFMLNEQADILEAFKGKGDLVPIDPEAETI